MEIEENKIHRFLKSCMLKNAKNMKFFVNTAVLLFTENLQSEKC